MARHPIYKSPEEFESAVNEYFEFIKGESQHIVKEDGTVQENWKRKPEPPTITGLTLFLGFCDRRSFYDYEQNEGFSYTVKKARLRIEAEYEKALHYQSPTGAIFALKNFGWKDKQDIEHSGGMNITWHEEKTYEADEEANESY